MTCHLTSSKFVIFSLKSVGRLVHWSPASTLSPKILGSNPTQLKKDEKKFYQASKKQNQLFHGFDSESTSEILVMTKLPKLKPKFRLSGNRRVLRSFGENELLCSTYWLGVTFSDSVRALYNLKKTKVHPRKCNSGKFGRSSEECVW
jgi:hypothetical protein